MATSSIYTNVKIKSKSDCRKLVSALEHTKTSKPVEVTYSRPVEVIKGEKIKEIFK